MATESEERKSGSQEAKDKAEVTSKMPLADKVDADFLKLCDDLEISEDVRKKALVQLKSLVTGSSPEDIQTVNSDLFTCALYMAMVDSRMPYGPMDPQLQCGYLEAPSVTVTNLLKHTNLNITTFFKRMHLLKESFPLSDAVRHHLLCVEKNYCIVSALFYTFERLCRSVFREDPKMDEDSNEENVYFRENVMPPLPETEGVSFRKKLCWTLFLHAKNHFLVDNQDLNHAVLLLLCCLEFVLRTTPSFLLNSPYDVIRIGCLQTTENRTTNMLLKLAEHVKTSIEEVQVIQQHSTEPFFDELPHVDGDLDLDKLTEQYEERYRKEGDINEMLFLRHESHLIPSDYNKNRTSIDQKSETGSPQIMTPVRAAMNTVQQLKNILCNASDKPSAKLLSYFENCSSDPSTSISERLTDLQSAFTTRFLELSKSSQTTIADQRFTMGVRLYYRVMESMLDMEQERLSTNDFSKLLCSDSFHRSLLAASVEIVLMTYGLSCNPSICEAAGKEVSSFCFPWVLDVFHLQAFDFFKVLESYIKAETKLTREIIKHLQWVENRILECIAWKEGSSLYSTVENSDIQMPKPESPSTSDQTQNHNSPAEMFLSPMHPRSGVQPPTPTKGFTSGASSSSSRVSPSPCQDGTSRTPRRSQSLNLFFSKVGRTGYHRLQKLCTMLDVSKDVQHKIWTCFEYCITNKPGLMKNRHIDQIMMCSLYGICKVVEKEIKFKTIVHMYRELSNVDQSVYKNAFIHGNEFDSIIGFYNKVFMQNMKSYILQFSNNKQVTPTLSPVPRQLTSPLTASPVFSVPGRKRFYVSPLKESPFKAPPSPSQLTPRSCLLYSFGEGLGSEKLRNITESMSAFKRQSVGNTPKSLKRLRFDQISTEDDQSVPEKMPKVVKRLPMDVSPHKSPIHKSNDVSGTDSS